MTKKTPKNEPPAELADVSEDDTAPGAPSPSPSPSPSPASVVVMGAAAHDPLAFVDVAGAPRLTVGTWIAAKRLRPVESAAFVAWANANAPAEMSADEWAAQLEKFQKTPIK